MASDTDTANLSTTPSAFTAYYRRVHAPRRSRFVHAAMVSTALSLFACAHAPTPPVKPPTPVRATTTTEVPPALGPLVALGFDVDRGSQVDGPVKVDGHRDFAFRIRIAGAVKALILTSSDPSGTPMGGAVWDTIVGTDPIPASLKLGRTLGSQTTTLVVEDAQGVLLNPRGTLPLHTFGDEIVTLRADADERYFVSGRSFTLLVIRPNDAVDRSATSLL
ncbi:MAG: hypothetical protein NVS3B20_15730 [Polyangiales bacterium]